MICNTKVHQAHIHLKTFINWSFETGFLWLFSGVFVLGFADRIRNAYWVRKHCVPLVKNPETLIDSHCGMGIDSLANLWHRLGSHRFASYGSNSCGHEKIDFGKANDCRFPVWREHRLCYEQLGLLACLRSIQHLHKVPFVNPALGQTEPHRGHFLVLPGSHQSWQKR